MNERIKELALQAGIHLDYFGLGSCADGGNPDIGELTELIVKECVEVGAQAFLKDNRIVPVFPANQIKQHFGVE